jgi:hypothetical protein
LQIALQQSLSAHYAQPWKRKDANPGFARLAFRASAKRTFLNDRIASIVLESLSSGGHRSVSEKNLL